MKSRISGPTLHIHQLTLPSFVNFITMEKNIYRDVCSYVKLKKDEIERLISENPIDRPYKLTLEKDDAYDLIDYPPCGNFEIRTLRGKLLYQETYEPLTLVA